MSTQIYHFQYKIENHPKLIQIYSYGIFSQGTQEGVPNSQVKLATSVRATEVPLYFYLFLNLIFFLDCLLLFYNLKLLNLSINYVTQLNILMMNKNIEINRNHCT